MHHAAKLRSIDQVEDLSGGHETVKPQEITLARQVIGTFEAPLDLSKFHDEFVACLLAIRHRREACQRRVPAIFIGILNSVLPAVTYSVVISGPPNATMVIVSCCTGMR